MRLALGLLLLFWAGPAAAYDYSPAALAVLERGRTAAGGAGWNALRGWTETGAVNGVRSSQTLDPVRYGYRIDLGGRTFGYNGAGDWETSASGYATGYVDKATLGRARTLAFFNAYGFFFPHRFAAKGTVTGTRQLAGRSYDVLSVRPAEGLLRELWFDRTTRLLTRVVDRNGPSVVTLELSDYRAVAGVKMPFRVVLDDGDPKHRQVRVVEAIQPLTPDRAIFSLPRNPPPPSVGRISP
jgi:hypothetical protein